MANITGFNSQKRREYLHREATDALEKAINMEADKESGNNSDIGDRDCDNQTKVLDNLPNRLDTKHVLSELSVTKAVNRESKRELCLIDDEFSRYDAEDKDYIAEIKMRGSWYPDCLIEHDKAQTNVMLAEQRGKEFIYIVATSDDIYVFNVSTLWAKGYKFNWDWKELPKNTDFGGKDQKITKFVGYLNVLDASVHYQNKP